MPESFEITGESDLLRALEMIENGNWPDDLAPRFVDWPLYEIAIDGDDFDGGIPTRVIPALTALQRTMNRAYARSVHGSPRRLNTQERRQAQLIIRLEPGSTKFIVALASLLNAAFKNMSGQQKGQTIVAVAAILASSNVLTAKIEAQTERLQLENQRAIEAQQTQRLQVFASLASPNVELTTKHVERTAQLTETKADRTNLDREWLKCLDDTDRLFINGKQVEVQAKQRETIRLPPDHDHILADFRILAVDSIKAGQGFRIRVVNLRTGERMRVSVSEDTTPQIELEALLRNALDGTALRMEIAAERSAGKVQKATLLSVEPARDIKL